jgi:glycosyltransferase involved in cell wall biosynthesis
VKRRPLRVLHLNTERTWRGGEQQTLYLMEGLRARGIEQLLVAQRGGALAERARALGLPVKELRMRGEADLFAVLELARLLREGRFTVLHAHTSHGHSLGALAAALLGSGRPRVLVARRVDFSIFRRSFFGLNRIKYVHGVDQYATVSRAIKEVLLKDGLPEARISVVHSGIDLARIDDAPRDDAKVRREFSVPEGDFLVGNVAHMADHKGQVYLVEAVPLVLERVPNATFAIVGDGELRVTLETRARELGVADRVRFPGFREDVPVILKALSVFVMPSHMEGLGTSVLDAMAAGAPVVGTTAGGMTEMIDHGRNGLVCPVRDQKALARAIVELLLDREKAAAFAAEARRLVVERFSKEAMVAKTVEIYGELLQEARRLSRKSRKGSLT